MYYLVNTFNKNNGIHNYITRACKILNESGVEAECFCPTQKHQVKEEIANWMSSKIAKGAVVEIPDSGYHLYPDISKINSHIRLHASKEILYAITKDPKRKKLIAPTQQFIAKGKILSSPSHHNLLNYRMLPCNNNEISVYPNPIEAYPSLGSISREIDVTFIGRFDLIKGADFFRSLLHYLPKGISVRAIGIENNSYIDEHEWSKKYDIKLLGWVDNDTVQQVLSNTKVALLLSRTENFSLAAVEAMSYGCKLATWDLPMYKEIYESGLPVYAVPYGNTSMLAAVVEGLLSDASHVNMDCIKHYIEKNNVLFISGVKNIIYRSRSKLVSVFQTPLKRDELPVIFAKPKEAEDFTRNKLKILGFSLFNNHIEEIWMPFAKAISYDYRFISARNWGDIKFLKKSYPIDSNKCLIRQWKDDFELIINEISSFRPDVIFVFNKNHSVVRKITEKIWSKFAIPTVFFELGWFPQQENVYCDSEGINHNSSLARKSLEELLGQSLISEDKVFHGFRYNRALLVLQMPKDSTMLGESYPKQLNNNELIRYVRAELPAYFELVVRPHPKDEGKENYFYSLPNTRVDISKLEDTLLSVDVVIGVNSTVLLEAMSYDVNIYSLGYGIFSNKGVTINCAENDLSESWQDHISFDANRRKYFLDYLRTRQINLSDLWEGKLDWQTHTGLSPIFDVVSLGDRSCFFAKQQPSGAKNKPQQLSNQLTFTQKSLEKIMTLPLPIKRLAGISADTYKKIIGPHLKTLIALPTNIHSFFQKRQQEYRTIIEGAQCAKQLLQYTWIRDRYPEITNLVARKLDFSLSDQPNAELVRELSGRIDTLPHTSSAMQEFDWEILSKIYKFTPQSHTVVRSILTDMLVRGSFSLARLVQVIKFIKLSNIDDRLLYEYCKLIPSSKNVWKQSFVTFEAWALYFGVMQAYEEAELSDLLQKHKTQLRLEGLHKDLLASKFANKRGFTTPAIEFSNNLASLVLDDSSVNLFADYIRNKTVAIIGNGPYEIGSGNGKKIDSYDVVIRFNDYVLGDKFKDDYGTKTDVWALAASFSPKKLPDEFNEIQFIVEPAGFTRYLYRDEKLSFYNDMINKKSIAGCPESFLCELSSRFCLGNPTSGFLMAAWIKEINQKFSAEDMFGFAFKKPEETNRISQHYYNSGKKMVPHSLKVEMDMYSSLFSFNYQEAALFFEHIETKKKGKRF